MISHLSEIHLVEWALAITLNAVVLFVISHYSPKTMGKYPWLLAAYSIFNVSYTTLDVIVAPTCYIFGRIYTITSWTMVLSDEQVTNWMLILYCNGFSQLLFFLSSQFFYRYVVVCRSSWLSKLEPVPTTLAAILLYFLVCGVWTVDTYVALNRDEEIFAQIEDEYRAVTGRNINGSGSIVQAFEKVSLYIILRSYIGMLVYCVILSSTSALIIFCGWSLYETLEETGKSLKTRSMQKELFKALIFQLIVPLISVYIPTSIFFLSALLGFDGWDTEMLTISIMLDPILEPLVIMYFIKCYRRPIARFLCCGQNSVCGFETSERKHNGLNRTTTGTNTNASTSNRNQISPESKETSHHSFHG